MIVYKEYYWLSRSIVSEPRPQSNKPRRSHVHQNDDEVNLFLSGELLKNHWQFKWLSWPVVRWHYNETPPYMNLQHAPVNIDQDKAMKLDGGSPFLCYNQREIFWKLSQKHTVQSQGRSLWKSSGHFPGLNVALWVISTSHTVEPKKSCAPNLSESCWGYLNPTPAKWIHRHPNLSKWIQITPLYQYALCK